MRKIKSLSIKLSMKLLAAGLLAMLVLTGCSQKNKSAENVLEFYHAFYHAESEWPVAKAMRDIFDGFAALHSGEAITFKPIAVQNANDIASAQIAGGNFPDIVYLNGGVPASAISQGLVLDLKPYIDAEGLQTAVGLNYTQNNVNGAIYTVHDQIETRGLWINVGILREAGVQIPDLNTWSGFASAMEKVRATGDKNYGYIAGQGSRFIFNAMLAETEKGRKMLTSHLTSEYINSPEFKDAFMRTAQLDKANGSAHTTADIGNMMADFNSRGIVAVLHNGVWNAGAIDESVMSNIVPGIFPNSVGLLSAGTGITVSAKMSDAKKALALEFLKYMVSEDVQKKIFLDAQANPCNTSIDLNLLVAQSTDNVSIKLANAIMQVNRAQTVVSEASHVWGHDITNAITNALMECAVSTTDIEARFNQLQQELIAIIS